MPYITCPNCGETYELNYSEERETWDTPGSCEFDDCPHCGYRLTNEELTRAIDNYDTTDEA